MSCSNCNAFESESGCGCGGQPQQPENGADCPPKVDNNWRPVNPFENTLGPQTACGRKSSYPVDAIAAQGTSRVEPLLTPEQLQSRFLKGIPLVSATMNPFTKKADIITSNDLMDFIVRAVNEAEMMTGINIIPVKYSEGQPLDRSLLNAFMMFKTLHRPILSVSSIAIRPGVGGILYEVPAGWISTTHYNSGQINLVPLVFGDTDTNGGNTATGGGAVFFGILGGYQPWLPVYWELVYTAGYPDGSIPIVLNELIGVFAAIEVLGILGATNRASSASMGIDSMSQSISTGGTGIYAGRIQALEAKKQVLISKFKILSGQKFSFGTM